MNEMTPTTHQQFGANEKPEERKAEEKENPPTSALAAKRFSAFDLSCRACGACGAGAGCWAWIPVWQTLGFRPQPPISENQRLQSICCWHWRPSMLNRFRGQMC